MSYTWVEGRPNMEALEDGIDDTIMFKIDIIDWATLYKVRSNETMETLGLWQSPDGLSTDQA